MDYSDNQIIFVISEDMAMTFLLAAFVVFMMIMGVIGIIFVEWINEPEKNQRQYVQRLLTYYSGGQHYYWQDATRKVSRQVTREVSHAIYLDEVIKFLKNDRRVKPLQGIAPSYKPCSFERLFGVRKEFKNYVM